MVYDNSEDTGPDGLKYGKSEWIIQRRADGEIGCRRWTEEDGAEKPIMECGHTAQGTTEIPDFQDKGVIKIKVCVICGHSGKVAQKEQPNLKGRKAKCFYCSEVRDSKTTLPFFEQGKSDSVDSDRFYCGCRGWD